MGSTSTHDFPPGYRFYPTEEELVGFYLLNKLEGRREDELNRVIPVQDISCVDPWALPNKAGEKCRSDQEQWFFFNPQQEKEANGGRPNRITTSGYWKATGSPSVVYSSQNQEIGVKKTMVFYNGKAPVGKKTKWKVNEYKAIASGSQQGTPGELPRQLRQEYSVCRVYVGSGCMSFFDRRPLPTQPIMNTTIPPNQHQQLATPMFGGHEMLEENIGSTSSANLDFLPSQEPRDQSSTNDTSFPGGFQNVDDGGMDELLQSTVWDDLIDDVLTSIEHGN